MPSARSDAEVQIEDVERRGFDHHLELVVVLQAERVLAVAPVGRPARGLHVGGAPGLGPERAQERRGVEGAGAHLHVVGLQDARSPAPPSSCCSARIRSWKVRGGAGRVFMGAGCSVAKRRASITSSPRRGMRSEPARRGIARCATIAPKRRADAERPRRSVHCIGIGAPIAMARNYATAGASAPKRLILRQAVPWHENLQSSGLSYGPAVAAASRRLRPNSFCPFPRSEP